MISKREWLAAALIWTLGCGGAVEVLTNFDRAYDFRGKRTYKWQTLPADQLFPMETQDTAGLDRLIKATVDEELQYKGFEKTDDAAYLLTYVVDASERLLATDSPSTTDWDPSKGPTHYGSAVLAIDFLDASSNDRVWRGAARTDFQPGKGRQRVRDVVVKILEEFPPKK